jgi:hypothetical protein
VFRRFAAACGLTTLALCYEGSASANPRPLPFSYPHEQLAEGGTEIEQYTDFTPVKADPLNTGTPSGYGLFQFQTEFEHGITNRLELGLYVTYAPNNAAFNTPGGLEGNGMKQRLRYKLADTGVWPLDVSVYGELTENDKEFEIEGKVILQRRFGVMRIIANANVEQEFEYNGRKDIVISPSGGLTFDAWPAFQPGIEWWMRGEYAEENPPPRTFNLGPEQYVGPAALVQFGSLWWTNGVYVRVTDWNHSLEAGDVFGKVWIRSVVGLGF